MHQNLSWVGDPEMLSEHRDREREWDTRIGEVPGDPAETLT
jgi:hypothetical protein